MADNKFLPIVGMYYRPPAKALLAVLPIGTKLTLLAEPENPHDPNAVAVWLDPHDIPETAHDILAGMLAEYGYTLEQVLEANSWHIGYIPRDLAAMLRRENIVTADEPLGAFYSMSNSGAPHVRLNGG